jgi:hypothetical protein
MKTKNLLDSALQNAAQQQQLDSLSVLGKTTPLAGVADNKTAKSHNTAQSTRLR